MSIPMGYVWIVINNLNFMKALLFSTLVWMNISMIYSQTGNISHIQVSPHRDVPGKFEVRFDLEGQKAYNISLEVSFDGGNTYTPVPETHISGDVLHISSGTDKVIVWDGMAGFPDKNNVEANLKIIAYESIELSSIYTISEAASIPLPLERAGVNANVVNNNIYIFGGYSGSEPFSDKVYKYNTASNSWSDLGSILPYGLIAISNNVSVFNSSEFYITPSRGPYSNNGWGLNKNIMKYSTLSNSVAIKTSFPENSWHIASTRIGSFIYMFGRHTGSDHRNIFRYNPISDELVDLGNKLPIRTSHQAIVKSTNGDIYLFGGRNHGRSLVIFDPDVESIEFFNEEFLPFEMYVGVLWENGDLIFIIDTATGKVYEFDKSTNTIQLSQFQIFENETTYRPMVSKDNSTGIVYLISGREGNTLVNTVRKLIPKY